VKRLAVAIATTFFCVMAAVVTFPGLGPFNTIRPFIFGIPFVFAWVLAWVAVSTVVFYMLHRAFFE
jgi:hypothetical protein